ncbi:MAG: hypothetical protein AAB920_01330, partial [Patescibacteria group bacterium]
MNATFFKISCKKCLCINILCRNSAEKQGKQGKPDLSACEAGSAMNPTLCVFKMFVHKHFVPNFCHLY